jgi:DNA mismatch repair protein MutS2
MIDTQQPDIDPLFYESLKQLEFDNILQIVSQYANSELGKQFILKSYPVNEIWWLNREHQLIDEMTKVITEDDPLPLENLKDIKTILHKSLVTNAILTTGEILKVRDVIRTSRLLKGYFRSKQELYPALYEETEQLESNRLLEKHISDCIDDTAEVKDSASRELMRIRRDIQEKSARLRNRVQKIMKRVADEEMLQEDFVSIREGRFVLPVKIENKRKVPGIIHGVSQTGATVFLEPSEIIEMNNEMSLLLNEEKREVYRILQNLTSEIGDNAKLFLKSVDILAHLDGIYAKARYALEVGGIKPEISEEPEINLINIRHPLLVHNKGRENVVPLTINFNDKIRGHLISGPNAGGKTVALKSIGLNIAMALSGIFPLGICRTNYRNIYSAIGDHQSIADDLSTFSSQISQLKKILDNCDSDSLVLVDEIGSGTDPQEGSALAAGIIDSFININLFFVVTTHQSSLKSYALTREEIENDSLEFSEEQLKPTYKFLTGIPGNSYAFVLAENLGIPKHILEKAKTYVGEKQSQIEESIRVLQKVRKNAEELERIANLERKKADDYKKKYDEKFREIKAKRQELMRQAREEAEDILNKANALIERTIREIREEKRTIAETKHDYETEKKKLKKKIEAEYDKKETKAVDTVFNVGDFVQTEHSGTVGNILDIDDENKTALIDFNGVKFRLPFNQLIKTKSKPRERRTRAAAENIKFDSKVNIDLRGKRVEEALRETDEFISGAIMSNIAQVTIIHGKGTGALRAAIQEYLQNHPSIKSYRNGKIEEGGDGVTVVEI